MTLASQVKKLFVTGASPTARRARDDLDPRTGGAATPVAPPSPDEKLPTHVPAAAAVPAPEPAVAPIQDPPRPAHADAHQVLLPPGIVQLGRKMGDGAFSNVYEALYDDHGRRAKVAIKCVRKQELVKEEMHKKHLREDAKDRQKPTGLSSILKEVQIMKNLNHPNIIRLYNYTETDDYYFLTLELMSGGELFHQIVKLTYFSEDLSRHVILQVANGIRYLHEEVGVVHRDIKPENILFEPIPIIPSRVRVRRPYDDENKLDEGLFTPGVGGGGIGRIKIADFGLSKVIWDEDTMTPCGTVGYTAPEIVRDETYSKSVDMWAMGCVLYTLLCGFPPFYDESINVLTEKVAKGYYTFLSPWWDDISISSKDLIRRLLNVDPAKRCTIYEFMAHPWCNPQLAQQAAAAPLPSMHSVIAESPLLAPEGYAHASVASPSLSTLKEAFDVTYAVHRKEEENRARNATKKNAFMDHVPRIEEEDEDSLVSLPQPATMTHMGHNRQHAHNPESIFDNRAGQRDRGRRDHRGFELSLNKATLLGRRNKLHQLPTPLS